MPDCFALIMTVACTSIASFLSLADSILSLGREQLHARICTSGHSSFTQENSCHPLVLFFFFFFFVFLQRTRIVVVYLELEVNHINHWTYSRCCTCRHTCHCSDHVFKNKSCPLDCSFRVQELLLVTIGNSTCKGRRWYK